jgi:hypothetical protein
VVPKDGWVLNLLGPKGPEVTATTKTNKKIAPRTVLHKFDGGSVSEQGARDNVFHWSFTKPSDMVFADDKVQSLGSYIQQSTADGLYQHSKFTKGVAPSGFVPKKSCAYFHTDDTFGKVWASIKGSKEFTMMWAVRVEAGKILPDGVVLVNLKQIIAKAPAASATAA